MFEIPLWNGSKSNNSLLAWVTDFYNGQVVEDPPAMNPALLKKTLRLLAELTVLLALFLIGSQLAAWLAWPIPGGVMGLALLLILFATGLLKPAALQLGAGWLMAEMLLFFIPALMSLLDYGSLLRDEGWRILLVIAVSTLLVMLVTAVTVELVCRWRLRHEP
jgi:holin-like protein